ncbi:MAG: hypothetical protein ACYDCI_08995 [Candidatus Limnocylindrales bacterium]
MANAQLQLDLARISPGELSSEATAYLLNPTIQSVGVIPPSRQDVRAIP